MGRNLVETLVKLRTLLVMGLLIAALSVLNFFMGCEKEDPKPLYGVPPDSLPDGQNDEELRVYYGPTPVDVVEDAADQPEAVPLYGVQPTDVVDVPPEKDVQPEMAPLYGVQPVDAVEVVPNDIEEEIPDRPLYGIPPTDVVETVPEDAAEEIAVRPLYGIQPVDLVEEDAAKDVEQEVMAWYGPAPLYGAQGCN